MMLWILCQSPLSLSGEPMRIASLDTETTGTDLFHGAQPFFVTSCEISPDNRGEVVYWEWTVDPLTRQVSVDQGDVAEIRSLMGEVDLLVLQNSVFDAKALATIGIRNFPWHKVRDTLLASHLLSSNTPHSLDVLSEEYLGLRINGYEEATHVACEACRRWCRSHRPDWMIAKRGLPCMPSAKETVWKYDLWLPKLVAQQEDCPEGAHRTIEIIEGTNTVHATWDTLTEEYANCDSRVTVQMWPVMEKELRSRGLWAVYLERLKLLPITYNMETRGITISAERLQVQRSEYIRESDRLAEICEEIASGYGYNLILPKSGRNQSLNKFVFDVLKLPVLKETETGNPAFDADVKDEYEATLPHDSPEHRFIVALNKKAKCDTAISYSNQYESFWVAGSDKEFRILHPKANPTGTDTLRWSFANPNSANLSKQKDEKTGDDYNLRRSFGPMPGRVHYSFDGRNVELRIPAYEAKEEELIKVFERPNDPPYFGSYHLVIFDTLHPEKFAKDGKRCKDLYESTWYQWVKNGNFARQYGAQEELVDATYRVPGGYKLISSRFPKIDELNRRMIAFANKHGYVETIPDRVVDPQHGYPLRTARGWGGKVKPTLPLCYRVSGTAMQWMNTVMIVVEGLLSDWRSKKFDGWIINQVHDEIILDFPAERVPGEHKPYIDTVKREMERVGDRIGVPIPVTAERHDESWAVGVGV